MNIEDYRNYCLSLGDDVEERMPFKAFRYASEVLVFYVCGHMFSFFDCNNFSVVTLKCQPDRIEDLKERHSCIGKPFNESPRYWIGVDPATASDTLLKELTLNSYNLVREKYQQPPPKKNLKTLNTPTGKDYVGSDELYAEVQRTMRLCAEMNSGWHTEAEVRKCLREITRSEVPDTVRVFTPLNINYGPGVRFGDDCFLNFGCTLLAIGGITIGDGVFIGPHCVLATEYHPEDPATRHTLLTKPIVIGRNAWLGADVKVLAGVTIGENAIVAAGSVVTKDVPANTVVAGSPARVIRPINSEK